PPPAPMAVGSANVTAGRPDNLTRSGLAMSSDLRKWDFHSWITPADRDDRNVILFPEKISGRYVVLRRPLEKDVSNIWISFSDTLREWSEPKILARARFAWENNRIGGGPPPLRTDQGWLVFYHGVETTNAAARSVVYRMGALLLDLEDPQ